MTPNNGCLSNNCESRDINQLKETAKKLVTTSLKELSLNNSYDGNDVNQVDGTVKNPATTPLKGPSLDADSKYSVEITANNRVDCPAPSNASPVPSPRKLKNKTNKTSPAKEQKKKRVFGFG